MCFGDVVPRRSRFAFRNEVLGTRNMPTFRIPGFYDTDIP
jgi:hypothetical protein